MNDVKAQIRLYLAKEDYSLAINLLEELKKNTYDDSFIDIFFVYYYSAYCYFKEKELFMCLAELQILKILFKNEENIEIYNYDYIRYKNLKREVDEYIE